MPANPDTASPDTANPVAGPTHTGELGPTLTAAPSTPRIEGVSTLADGFRHEAFVYAGETEFLQAAVPFVRDALAADEPVLVAVSAHRGRLLHSALGADARDVRFVDMAHLGRNPARIIPAWRDFLTHHTALGRRVRGIGEPIWAGRRPAELVECHRHEALLNLAFRGRPAWWLLCPYDTSALDPEVVDEAMVTHPYVLRDGQHRPTGRHRQQVDGLPYNAPLPEPAGPLQELAFDGDDLPAVRHLVATHASRVGLDEGRTDDLLLAVQELAVNSLRHGGGQGRLRVWPEDDELVCEVRDRGHIDQPLVGRERPALDAGGGRGLWLVNHLCDLVEIRSRGDGSVVRVHMATTSRERTQGILDR